MHLFKSRTAKAETKPDFVWPASEKSFSKRISGGWKLESSAADNEAVSSYFEDFFESAHPYHAATQDYSTAYVIDASPLGPLVDLIRGWISKYRNKKHLKRELAQDIIDKLIYLLNVVEALKTLARNLDAIGSSGASDREKIRAMATTMKEFCTFEASLDHIKSTALWDRIKHQQDSGLSESEKAALRNFYLAFSIMASAATRHNESARRSLEKVFDILQERLGSLAKALERLGDAARSIDGMVSAYRDFVRALE